MIPSVDSDGVLVWEDHSESQDWVTETSLDGPAPLDMRARSAPQLTEMERLATLAIQAMDIDGDGASRVP